MFQPGILPSSNSFAPTPMNNWLPHAGDLSQPFGRHRPAAIRLEMLPDSGAVPAVSNSGMLPAIPDSGAMRSVPNSGVLPTMPGSDSQPAIHDSGAMPVMNEQWRDGYPPQGMFLQEDTPSLNDPLLHETLKQYIQRGQLARQQEPDLP